MTIHPMKRRLLLIALLPLALGACTERQEAAVEADAAEAAGALDAAAEQFRADAQRTSADLDQRIQSMERAAENATGDAREAYNETLNEIRQERVALQADLDRLATVSQDDFDDLRDDIAEKQADLEADLDEASLRLADSKAEFEAAAQRRLAALDRDLERFDADATVATGAPEDAAEASLESLRERRRDLGERFDRIGPGSDDDFRRWRGELAEDFAELRRDFAEAANRLAAAARPDE